VGEENSGSATKAAIRTIILAEDNDDDAFLTMRALDAAGISNPIHHCRDGQAVIEFLEGILREGEDGEARDFPELLLLDLKMPRVGGLETLRWIRDHEVFNALVVLALTSSSEERDVTAAHQMNINAYLVKPSSLSEMIDVARAIRHFWLDQNHLIRPRASFPPLSDAAARRT
jgi:CheY-like chemotaxis protein